MARNWYKTCWAWYFRLVNHCFRTGTDSRTLTKTAEVINRRSHTGEGHVNPAGKKGGKAGARVVAATRSTSSVSGKHRKRAADAEVSYIVPSLLVTLCPLSWLHCVISLWSLDHVLCPLLQGLVLCILSPAAEDSASCPLLCCRG